MSPAAFCPPSNALRFQAQAARAAAAFSLLFASHASGSAYPCYPLTTYRLGEPAEQHFLWERYDV